MDYLNRFQLRILGCFFALLLQTNPVHAGREDGRRPATLVEFRSGDSPDERVPESEATRIRAVINGVNAFLPPLKAPERIQVVFSKIDFHPAANDTANVTKLGIRFGTRDHTGPVYTQNPSVMTAIISHEYGHLLFGGNIKSRLPWFAAQAVLRREDNVRKRASPNGLPTGPRAEII